MTDTWDAWKAQIRDDPRAEWTAELGSRLEPGARSGFPPEVNRRLVRDAGLETIRDAVVTIHEPVRRRDVPLASRQAPLATPRDERAAD